MQSKLSNLTAVSSFFLVTALSLGVMFGAQLQTHTWGPALLAMALASIAAIASSLSRGNRPVEPSILILGLLAISWLGWRAWVSPVKELALADGLLLAAAASCFILVKITETRTSANRIIAWGLAIILTASMAVMVQQLFDPEFAPVFNFRSGIWPSGFYGHYSYGAHFLFAASLLLGGAAASSSFHKHERLAFAFIAACGILAVYFTKSRGGIIGAAAGCVTYGVIIIALGIKHKRRWAPAAAIITPIVCIAVAVTLIKSLEQIQTDRNAPAGMAGFMDNTVRLFLLGIAFDCISKHPLGGGGSRSFSWECFQFWDPKIHGPASARPEHVHNEIVQTVTDYGLVGAFLLFGLISTVLILGAARCWLGSNADSNDGIRVGGIAATIGMLAQSNFEGVMRLMPGVMIFGLCLAAACRQNPNRAPFQNSRFPSLCSATLATLLLLLVSFTGYHGWIATKSFVALWPTHYQKNGPDSPENRIASLSEAISIRANSQLLLERSKLLHRIATSRDQAVPDPATIQSAINDYDTAAKLHPYNPTIAIHQAILLSEFEKSRDAEQAFANAIRLQGGMESAFRARYSLGIHLLRKGLSFLHGGQISAAQETLEWAAVEIEQSFAQTPAWVFGNEGRNIRVTIHESLGAAREETGDETGALESYRKAATIPNGDRANYRIAVLFGKRAVDYWNKRRAGEALFLFREARRFATISNSLPASVSPEDQKNFVNYLDDSIRYLNGANILPIEPTE